MITRIGRAISGFWIAIFFFLGLSTSLGTKASDTAYAATQSNLLCFDYEYFYKESDNDAYQLRISEKGVTKTEALECGDFERTSEITFQAVNATAMTKQSDVEPINALTFPSNPIFRAISNFSLIEMNIQDSYGMTFATSPSNIVRTTLTEGTYTLTYTGESSWNKTIDDRVYKVSSKVICKIKIKVDCSPPDLTCSIGSFEVTTSEDFTVFASDDTGVTLYYRTPEDTAYQLADTPYFMVNGSDADGVYFFYASDDLGNTSEVVWIERIAELPKATIEYSTTDNGVRVKWENESYTATINDQTYSNGKWITEEGKYQVVVSNKIGRSSVYSFVVGHNFVKEKDIPPTCTEEGYTLYVCSSCKATDKREFISPSGHQYTTSEKEPTCTRSGGIYHTCHVCGYTFITDEQLPEGHVYRSEVICSATCTQKGERQHTCEKCGDTYQTIIPETGHHYQIEKIETHGGITTRTYRCTICNSTYQQEMGAQYEKVASYIEYLFDQYSPYMVWMFLATSGVWSIAIGVAMIVAHKNEEKEKARRMIVNYIVGLIVIFAILVACPYLIRGIAILLT